MRKLPSLIVDGVFTVVVGSPARPPSRSLPRRLKPLFRELAQTPMLRDPEEITELIWAIWIAHPDRDATDLMIAAIEAMAAGAPDLALPILDRLVADHPEWAEAWNKRSTLAFMQRRYVESLSDIGETLVREPRHFGAILGFAQIALKHGYFAEAKAAFEIAQRIHPHLSGIAAVIKDLNETAFAVH